MSTTTLFPFLTPIPMLINVFILLASTTSTSVTATSSKQLTNNPQGISPQRHELGFNVSLFQAESKVLLNLSLGNPATSFSAILELSSDLIWTQCMPCESCYHTPIFNPNTSHSFYPLPCSKCDPLIYKCDTNLCKYRTLSEENILTEGYLAKETFIIGDLPKNLNIPDIVFGCGTNNRGLGLNIAAGVVGLGRGPLSLVSQLKLMKFSYCLPMEGGNKKGILSLGSAANEGLHAGISQATPIIANPMLPSLYYISPEGISLDDASLPITPSTFELKKDGKGGMYLDTGHSLTYLVQEAYQILRQEFVKRTNLPVVSVPHSDLDLCFRAPPGGIASSLNFPKLKFHLRAGVVLELPKENYLIEDTRTGVVCLAIVPINDASILGTKMLQNFIVLHDLETQTISFFPSQCA